uniref:Uncharacterized protein n=1 Tax=uncultured marine virus TaxID=186617 RepID=A0A0F7L4F0_9VIRU|nr:hypothetical protein [uncultured marine virus]
MVVCCSSCNNGSLLGSLFCYNFLFWDCISNSFYPFFYELCCRLSKYCSYSY